MRPIDLRRLLVNEVRMSSVVRYDTRCGFDDYKQDIFQNICDQSHYVSPRIDPSYIYRQQHVTIDSRQTMIDILVHVHGALRLPPPCLFRAVHLLDRYLSVTTLLKDELAMCALASLIIAAKVDAAMQIDIPCLSRYLHNTVTPEQFYEIERNILTKLGFTVDFPTEWYFLQHVTASDQNTKCHESNALMVTTMHYILDRALLEYSCLQFSPHIRACAAMYMVIRTWTPAHVAHTRITEQELKECAATLTDIVSRLPSPHHHAFRSKWQGVHVADVAFPTEPPVDEVVV